MDEKFIFKYPLVNIILFIILTPLSDDFYYSLAIEPKYISIIKYLAYLIILITFGTLAVKKKKFRVNLKKYMSLWALLILFGISILWTGYKSVAIMTYINFISLTAYFIYLMEIHNKDFTIDNLRIYSYILVTLNVIYTLFIPGVSKIYAYGLLTATRGVHSSRSALSMYLLFCIFILIYHVVSNKGDKRKNIVNIVFIIFSSALIVYSGSSTGLIGLLALFIMTAFYLINKLKLIKLSGYLTLISSFSLVLLPMHSEIFNNFLKQVFHKTVTFSGRTFIWTYSKKIIYKHIWLGLGLEGYLAHFNYNYLSDPFWRQAAHCHHGLLDIALSTGLVGILLFIIICIKIFSSVKKERTSSVFFVILFVVILINAMMEPYLINRTSFPIVGFCIIYILSFNEVNKECFFDKKLCKIYKKFTKGEK